MSDMQDKIRKIINKVCHPKVHDLSNTTKSLLELGLDSLDFASILMAIEDEYSIGLVDQDVSQLLSIDQIEGFLRANGKA